MLKRCKSEPANACSDKPDARPEINEDFEAILAGRKRRKLSEMAKDVKRSGIEDLIENIDKGKLDTTFKDAKDEEDEGQSDES